jgi:hypothetical protein
VTSFHFGKYIFAITERDPLLAHVQILRNQLVNSAAFDAVQKEWLSKLLDAITADRKALVENINHVLDKGYKELP